MISRPFPRRRHSPLEEPIPLLPCLLRRFIFPGFLLLISTPEEIAEIACAAITHRFALRLPALVGGMGIVKRAVEAASHIAAALRTEFPPAHDTGKFQLCTAEITSLHVIAFRLQRYSHEILRQHHISRELPFCRPHYIMAVAGRV